MAAHDHLSYAQFDPVTFQGYGMSEHRYSLVNKAGKAMRMTERDANSSGSVEAQDRIDGGDLSDMAVSRFPHAEHDDHYTMGFRPQTTFKWEN